MIMRHLTLIKRLFILAQSIQMIRTISLIFLICISFKEAYGTPPSWTINGNTYQNSMTGIFIVSDECIASNDPGDMVAVFDISGEIRGVEQTDVNGKAFLTIYSNGAGEELFFKIYDAGTDKVFNIYDYTLTFISDGSVGTPPDDPIELNFDSQPTGVDAGPDQEIWNNTMTTLEASGDGHWKIIFGAGGSISNPGIPNPILTGVLGQRYILAWTLNDDGGCIGETDEMEVVFVINEPENNAGTCSDGLDNDGDGNTDCEDGDCGRPVVTDIIITEPTPINCTSTESDGTFEIIHTGADLFSLDMGNTTQSANIFSGLDAGTYEIWMQNNLAGCIEIISVELENNFNPLETVGEIEVAGPKVVCVNTDSVYYSLEDIPELGMLTWSYSGTGVTIEPNEFSVKLNFSNDATGGFLTAVLTEDCGFLDSQLAIDIADPAQCGFSVCPKNISITNAEINAPGAPKVFRAGVSMTLNAQIPNEDFEFTAGTSITFLNGFEFGKGENMLIDIFNCNRFVSN